MYIACDRSDSMNPGPSARCTAIAQPIVSDMTGLASGERGDGNPGVRGPVERAFVTFVFFVVFVVIFIVLVRLLNVLTLMRTPIGLESDLPIAICSQHRGADRLQSPQHLRAPDARTYSRARR